MQVKKRYNGITEIGIVKTLNFILERNIFWLANLEKVYFSENLITLKSNNHGQKPIAY